MEQELAQANANLPSGNAPTQRVINWGGVLKGVAIVAAVAVVGVVGFSAFSGLAEPITEAIAGSEVASSIAVGAGNAATWLGEAAVSTGGALWNGLQYAGGFVGGLISSGMEGLGLTTATAAWEGAAATTKVVGIAGATATTALAAKAAMPAMQHLQLSADVPIDAPAAAASPAIDTTPIKPPPIQPANGTDTSAALGTVAAAQGAQTANVAHAANHSMLHDVTHAAHHAAEINDEHAAKNWSAKFAHKAAHSSYTDAVRASQAARTIPEPAATFSEELKADRANLDAALAK